MVRLKIELSHYFPWTPKRRLQTLLCSSDRDPPHTPALTPSVPGPQPLCPVTRSLRPAQQGGSRPRGELQDEAGAARVPSFLPRPWSRRGAPVTSLENSGSVFVPQLYSSATGSGKEFLAGAPRRPSPWHPEVPVLRPCERRGEGRRGAPAGDSTAAARSRAFIARPSPPWPPLNGNADAVPYTIALWLSDQAPFKAEGYHGP